MDTAMGFPFSHSVISGYFNMVESNLNHLNKLDFIVYSI